jgi:cellulose synthase/poly-beta-1,6-N-acetylglucosamine synthase-like glycosyltransferase
MLALANVLENRLFYAPKSRLGLFVALRGTGMVLHRDVLLRLPWNASSIVEDVEYTYQLIDGNQRVWFADRVSVTSDFPVKKRQLAVQRERWIAGNTRLAVTRAPRLFWQGLVRRNLVLIDAAWTTWAVSRPLILIQLALTIVLALLCLWLFPAPSSAVLVTGSLGIVVAYTLYVAAAVAMIGVTPKRIALLMQLPFIAVQYLGLGLRSLFVPDTTVWKRTPR